MTASVVSLLACSGAFAQEPSYILVGNPTDSTTSASSTVYAISNAGALTALATLPEGAEGLAVSPDGKNVYVSFEDQSFPTPPSVSQTTSISVAAINTSTGAVAGPANLTTVTTFQGFGPYLAGVVASPDSTQVYVLVGNPTDSTTSASSAVYAVGNTGALSALATTLPEGAEGLAVSPDGKNVYVSFEDQSFPTPPSVSQTTSISVAAINTSTGAVAGPANLTTVTTFQGFGPYLAGVVASPDSTQVYVLVGNPTDSTTSASSAVYAVGNTGALSALATTLPEGAEGLAVSPDGKNVYVSFEDQSFPTPPSVSQTTSISVAAINTSTGAVAGPANLTTVTTFQGFGPYLAGVVASPDSTQVYVLVGNPTDSTTSASSAVYAVGNTGALSALATTLPEGAEGLAVSPDGKNVYVSFEDQSFPTPPSVSQTTSISVAAINTSTGAVAGPVNLTTVTTFQGFGPYLAGVAIATPRPAGTLTLLDPVPLLLSPPPSNGSPIIGSSIILAALAPSARVIKGVAADGVTEVVIQIGGALPNESLQLSIDSDGQLANIGSSTFLPSSITLRADSEGNAFALYRAPDDFARPNGVDNMSATRTVDLQLQSLDNSTFTADAQITIVRPLVVLVHGLWSNQNDTWGQFLPLVNDSYQRFTVAYGNFDLPVSVSSASPSPAVLNPLATAAELSHVKANSLGLTFTTPVVLAQLSSALTSYIAGGNQAGIPVAAIQADIVSHSMGGLISRNLTLQLGFAGPNTLGQGLIHKLITIDTPHQGTPVATDFLLSANTCVRQILQLGGNFAFSTVTSNLYPYTGTGAVGDLRPQSGAIQNLQSSIGINIPTALIAGQMDDNNLAGISDSKTAFFLHNICGNILQNPLALLLTPDLWLSVFPFGQNENDGVVSVASQLDGLVPAPGLLFTFPGRIHSAGFESLGFSAPTMLDSGLTPAALPNPAETVIDLLNTPRTNTQLYTVLTP